MPEDPAAHQQNKLAESNQSVPAEPNPQAPDAPPPKPPWHRRFAVVSRQLGRVGILNYLLFGLVVIVTGILYLHFQNSPPNNTNVPPQLIIVQLNDIYRLDAVRAGKRGGLARVVTVLRQLKNQNPQAQVIVLHAGDFLSPSLESNLFKGMQMIDAMNFINDVAPLYAVPGNHEFDYPEAKKEDLTEAITKSRFKWIASNLELNDAGILTALKDHVHDYPPFPIDKIKLGIFGLTIDGAQNGKNRLYAPISKDYNVIAEARIKELEAAGADLIVGLTHLNISDDENLAKLKKNHPSFQWIAGGHEHSMNREPASSTTALITKGDSNARTIWKIAVAKNGDSVSLHEESIVIDESIPPDPGFTQNIENFYRFKLREERPYMDTVIADQLDRCYDGTEEAVRDRESDWGDLLTDTMRKPYKGVTADVAVLNGGSIRIDDTICDRVTFENLERTFAYETPIVLVKLTGKDLKESILNDSANSKRGDGRFLQVSGVSFRRDLSADSKIQDLRVQSQKGPVPFDDAKTYVVAVNKWIFDCGDGYKFRQLVKGYIPAGPDLRSLTYFALANQKKKTQPGKQPQAQPLARISDLPVYVSAPPPPAPKWQMLSDSERPCH